MNIEDLKIQASEELLLQALSSEQTLQGYSFNVLDAARFVRELCKVGRTRKLCRLRAIFDAGIDALAQHRQTLTFKVAFERYLLAKSYLRERTQKDYRGVFQTLIRRVPALSTQKMHTFGPHFAELVFPQAFKTLRQRHNAYAVLRAFFCYGVRHGWLRENPLAQIDLPRLREREIIPLTLPEISALFCSVKALKLEDCVPAIAVMLYAGVRPCEAERLCWRDFDLEEDVISIAPKHSKTGGSRHVSLLPILKKILISYEIAQKERLICPPNWRRKWKRIREHAGWVNENPWQQDVLRHTFASYHLKYFRNLTHLQCEMGHASLRLLRTRYLSMRGITREAAECFWSGRGIYGVLLAPDRVRWGGDLA